MLKTIGRFGTGYVGSIYPDIGWMWTFLIGSFSLFVGKLKKNFLKLIIHVFFILNKFLF